jgi:glutathione S-transferase
MSEVEPAVAKVAYNTTMRPPEQRIAAVADEGRAQFDECARVLIDHLATREYLLGSSFSAADVAIGGVLGWAKVCGLLEAHPKLVEYQRRLTGREAHRRSRAD